MPTHGKKRGTGYCIVFDLPATMLSQQPLAIPAAL
jgi:hypothetical protein